MDKKSAFASKTLIINILLILGAVAAMAGEEISKGTGMGVIIVNAVNIILRYFTTQPIK
jgi:hypothetical protein